MRKDQVRRLVVPGWVDGAPVTVGQRTVLEGTEERSPDAVVMVRNTIRNMFRNMFTHWYLLLT
jgi:hypothetical protein